MGTLQVKDFYDKLEEIKKDEQVLRHEQANKYQASIMSMEEKFERRFDKLEWIISDWFKKAWETFVTKIEHNYHEDRLWKVEWVITKIAWAIVLWFLSLIWATVFVVIMLFWEKF